MPPDEDEQHAEEEQRRGDAQLDPLELDMSLVSLVSFGPHAPHDGADVLTQTNAARRAVPNKTVAHRMFTATTSSPWAAKTSTRAVADSVDKCLPTSKVLSSSRWSSSCSWITLIARGN